MITYDGRSALRSSMRTQDDAYSSGDCNSEDGFLHESSSSFYSLTPELSRRSRFSGYVGLNELLARQDAATPKPAMKTAPMAAQEPSENCPHNTIAVGT